MKWIGLSFSIVAAGALIAGLIWASDLNGPSRAQASDPPADVEGLIAQSSGLSIETIHRMESAALGVVADKALASGSITSDQAAKLRNLTVTPILTSVVDGAAQSAHVTDQDLVDGLMSGKSLAQIADAQGVSQDDLKNSLSQVLQSQLATQESAGLLTASQSAMLVTALNANLDKVISFVPHSH